MSINQIKGIIVYCLFGFVSLFLFSCSSTKKIKYFQDIPDSGALSTIAKIDYIEPRIQVDDILTVIIQVIDARATDPVNLGNIITSTSGNALGASQAGQSVTSGYLVDKEGNIDISTVGKIKVAGLTTTQAKERIRDAAKGNYKEPAVIVRFANFKVNVAGEVGRPGSYIMPSEKVTLLDAISMAGDLTIYGKRENVLLVRENADGSRTPYRINLLKSNVMNQPYYYLRQNDYIYVEPNKGKAAATNAARTQTFAIVGSLLSVLIIAFSRI